MTRNLIVYGVALFLLAAIGEESAFRLTFYGVKPDLLLVFVVAISLLGGLPSAGVGALAAGWLQGAGSGIAVGSTVVSKAICALACSQAQPHVVRENPLTCMPVAFLATWVCEISFLLFYPRVWEPLWAARVGLEAVSNALIAPIIYAPLLHLSRRMPGTTT